MEMVSPAQLSALVDASAIQAVRAVADGRRFRLEVRAGLEWRAVATRRGALRRWSSLDSLARYCRRLGLGRLELDLAAWTPDQHEI